MNITNNERKRFCAYCGKEVEATKKRCLHCGSLLNLPIYNQYSLQNNNTNYIPKEATNNYIPKEDTNRYIPKEDTNRYILNPLSDDKPISISKKVIITMLMCLIPAIGPLFGMVVGFVYLGSSNKGSQRYSFGKSITIASSVVLLYNLILFFMIYAVYIDLVSING